MLLAMVACGNPTGGNDQTASGTGDKRVIIYSAIEDFREEHIRTRLQEQFPDYEIIIEYIATGDLAAKIKAEGTSSECDIVLALDNIYMESLSDSFEDLSSYDYSNYLTELVPAKKTYMVWERWSGCIAANTDILAQNNLPIPTSYDDLLKPEYKGRIIMPDPKSSGTGYFFIYQLAKTWGEDKTFAYFDSLAPNVLQFTASGSAPINSLVNGEASIAIGTTFKAVNERNDGAPLDILYFEEGAPYATSGCAILKGKGDNSATQEVFKFLVTTLCEEDKELFSPEIIFKDQVIEVPNYPDVPYANMAGYFDEAEKTRLLDKWKY
jgi:iron(III) transport system substrate-binding protein